VEIDPERFQIPAAGPDWSIRLQCQFLFAQMTLTIATMNITSPPKPKNRPLDLSRCRSCGISFLLAAFAMGVCEAAETIQTTGVLGSPSATTIDGKQLPPPDPKFGGIIEEKASDSKAW
jgi:hypothetical protein